MTIENLNPPFPLPAKYALTCCVCGNEISKGAPMLRYADNRPHHAECAIRTPADEDATTKRARLIAAAPDMLTALKCAREQLALAAIKSEQYEIGPIRHALSVVNTAIEYAEGQ